jgi:hypothetical protein
MFQELESYLNSEINTLAYPKAALFAFAIALIAYNTLAVVKAALRAVYGYQKIEEEVSGYYIADEVAGTYQGMMITIPQQEWEVFHQFSIPQLAELLVLLAKKVGLEKYKKHPHTIAFWILIPFWQIISLLKKIFKSSSITFTLISLP